MNMQAQNYLSDVRDQYEDYPYPKRDPADETTRLVMTSTARMDKLVMDGFGGRLDMRQPFRVLVAGGGTGDGAIYFAEQLKLFPQAEVVYLDLSTNSMAIAQARAQTRGLSNIRFVQGSILNASTLELGVFDVIECCGVLHHLADPEAGLKALTSVLKPQGIISLMQYARYGRTGVYMVQDLMRIFSQESDSKQDRVENCRKLLGIVPNTNALINMAVKSAAQEIEANGDIGIYDLFLHSQDRCYTVPELYAFAESAGLHILQFSANFSEGGRMIYNIRNYLENPEQLNKALSLPLPKQQAMAELLHGGMAKHMCVLGRQRPAPIDLRQLDVIPDFNHAAPRETKEKLLQVIRSSKGHFHLDLPPQGRKLAVAITPHLAAMLSLIDGERTLGQIYEAVAPGMSHAELGAEWLPVVALLTQLDLLCFRYQGTPSFSLRK